MAAERERAADALILARVALVTALPPLDGHKRKVRFDRPGTYQIWARNAYPTDAKSNVVTVTVRK